MDSGLNMSLDDIIKSRTSSGRGRVRGVVPQGRGVRTSFGSGRTLGMRTLRQRPLGVNARPSVVTISKSFRRSRNFPWQPDVLEESLVAAGFSRSDSGAKLFISNLDSGVCNDDIRELFSETGELKRYAIHLDKNGRPSGSAEVVYAKRSDAFAAVKRYNNVQLDGRPMKIKMLNLNSEVPVSPRVNVIGGMNGRAARKVVLSQPVGGTRTFGPISQGAGPRMQEGLRDGRGPQGGYTELGNAGRPRNNRQGQGQGGRLRNNGQGQGQGGSLRQGSSRGRRRGQGKKERKEKSAAELDEELDKYHAEAMQT